MKKILLLLLLLPVFSFSQMDFGIKGGGLISNIKTENDFYNKNRTSFYFGGFTEYKLSNFALNGSLEYLNTGAKKDDFSNLSIRQVNLFLSGKYYLVDRLSVSASGYIGYILGGDMEVDYTKLNIYNPNDPAFMESGKYSYDDYLSNIDLGLTVGIEFTIYKGLFVEARYMFGLNNIFKDVELTDSYDNPATTHKIESKNRVFLFGVGYKF